MRKFFLPLTLLALFPFFLTSCETTGKVSKDPVVHAEHVIFDANTVLDSFVHLEALNRDDLLKVTPEIHAYAEYVRKNAPAWLKRAYDLKQVYRSQSTPENLYNLNTILSTLDAAVAQSREYSKRID